MNSNRARTFTTSVYMLKGLLWKLSVSYYSQYLTQRNNPCGLTCPIKTSLLSTVCFSCWQHKWCHPSQKSFNRNRRVKVKRKTVELFRHFRKIHWFQTDYSGGKDFSIRWHITVEPISKWSHAQWWASICDVTTNKVCPLKQEKTHFSLEDCFWMQSSWFP